MSKMTNHGNYSEAIITEQDGDRDSEDFVNTKTKKYRLGGLGTKREKYFNGKGRGGESTRKQMSSFTYIHWNITLHQGNIKINVNIICW